MLTSLLIFLTTFTRVEVREASRSDSKYSGKGRSRNKRSFGIKLFKDCFKKNFLLTGYHASYLGYLEINKKDMTLPLRTNRHIFCI